MKKQRQKKPYEKPVIEKEDRMKFPMEIIDSSGKKPACKQCSSCHGCR